MRTTFFLAVVALAAITLDTETAHAGGCTPCETSAECVAALGEPAFCIMWTDGTTACPGTPTPSQGCCPGQGCSTFSGRPSCEEEGRCVVVDGTPRDAGMSGADAGPPRDSGPPRDAGMIVTGGSGEGRGCTCRAAGARTESGLAAILIGLLALTITTRRARRR